MAAPPNQVIPQEVTGWQKYFNLPQLLDYMKQHLFNVVVAIFIVIFFRKIRTVLQELCRKLFRNVLSDSPAIASFILSVISLVIDVGLSLTVLKLLGVELTGIFGVIGAFSLIIGFAFKDILSNFFGGVILLTFCPIKAQDVIVYNGYEGVVKRIEIFYTTLVDFQDTEIIIPNAKLMSNEVLNVKNDGHRRLVVQVGVGFHSDIEQVKKTIHDIIKKRDKDLFFIKGNPPVIGMYEIGASSLVFEIRVFVREKKYMYARYYLNEAMKTEFDRLGINIPYNITHIEIDNKLDALRIKKDDK